MAKRIGNRTIELENRPSIIGYGSVVGNKEHEGPLGAEFDSFSTDDRFGEESYEKAESRLQNLSLNKAIDRAGLKCDDIDMVFAGDLLNQCIGSTFGLREMGIPLVGLYGACSTMALGLCMAAVSVDCGAAKNAAAVTSSHFCSAERQYRFPLEYGSQRTPTAQWTVTGSGAVVLSKSRSHPFIHRICIGEIVDFNIKDANNMGAAMAPDDVKIRPYPRHEGMVFFYTQIQYLRGFRALSNYFKPYKFH